MTWRFAPSKCRPFFCFNETLSSVHTLASHLSDGPLSLLCPFPLERLQEARFSPEEHLFHVNEVAREMFLVVQGQLERLVEMNTGDFRQEGIFNKGDTVGDLSFFFGMRHFNSVKAFRGPCTVFFLQRHSFLQV